ncbi:MAG TPA: 2-C-methyl-D-erythritol 4-phosphate cytidylyltransferase [Terriglobales bacterium]|jgi:2-C-methyl-D-erythritol 4-phosphate cytidylyltransferase|nr:2-C-methyl-D-erythritol 4-phosphate cytidylyltransferase [Terriglobales bacterium]
MRTTAIVVAAGEGRRIGQNVSKTYLPIGGRPLILRTLDRVFSAPAISDVVLVIAGADLQHCEALLRGDSALSHRAWTLQSGGASRQQSVQRGLERVPAGTDIVVIHDGARPFVSAALLDRCIFAAVEKGAAVAGLPARDTIKSVTPDGWIKSTPERKTLWEIQTPQAFRRDLIVAAHDQARRQGIEATDDAMVVELIGRPVFVVAGERLNFKITVPEDIWLAELLVASERSV